MSCRYGGTSQGKAKTKLMSEYRSRARYSLGVRLGQGALKRVEGGPGGPPADGAQGASGLKTHGLIESKKGLGPAPGPRPGLGFVQR